VTKRETSVWGYKWATLSLGNKYRDLVLQVGDSRLTTLLCKIIVAKSKEVKAGWSNLIDKSGRIL
jgi:hypothetical protein